MDPDELIDRPIRPEPAYRTLHFLYLLLTALLGVSWWYLPLAWWGPGWAFLVVSGLLVVVFGLWLVWVPLYYRSLVYRVTRDEVHWSHGVLWQHEGIVPYNRITDVDVLQGPLMRLLGISTVRIQTAGQRSQATSEIKIAGVEVARELQALIMDRVRERPASGSAVHGGGEAQGGDGAVLVELRRIRELLEDRS